MHETKPRGATPLADTMDPPRNFTLSTEDRLRAFVQGVPEHLRRLRRIEDLIARLQKAVAESIDAAASAEVAADLDRLNALIEKHNRYYPIEARLPIDVRSRTLLDRGRPWRPLQPVTLDDLAVRGRR